MSDTVFKQRKCTWKLFFGMKFAFLESDPYISGVRGISGCESVAAFQGARGRLLAPAPPPPAWYLASDWGGVRGAANTGAAPPACGGTNRDTQGQTGTNRDKQGHTGTNRESTWWNLTSLWMLSDLECIIAIWHFQMQNHNKTLKMRSSVKSLWWSILVLSTETTWHECYVVESYVTHWRKCLWLSRVGCTFLRENS